MQSVYRSALLGALILSPAAALAQGLVMSPGPDLVVEDPLVIQEPMVGVPVLGADGVTDESARMIAMAAGLVAVEDVDRRIWDGNYEVEGTDAAGQDLEMIIDGDTGAIIEIDDD